MRKLTSHELKDLNLLKHYRIIRKWACKTCDLKEPDLELLIYLNSLELFTKQDFKTGVYSYSWDNRRWNRLLKQGWIIVWRKRNRTTQKYNIYKTSQRFKHVLNRIYRIMLGEEDMPTQKLNNNYMDKVLKVSIQNVNKDKQR
tara:strand:- start:325 stop:753 length:429 start_codon:yes stop_codon:yes gene_type:complete